MAKNSNMAVFVAMAAAALVMNSVAAATTYQVGDGLGWTIPPNASAYPTWANKTFAVGDILVFRYTNGVHDVAEVTKAAYDSCSATSPISLATSSPTSITLNSSGQHYFICTFSGHCGAGQKLSVSVTGASSPAPTPSTSSTPPPSPSPSPPVAVPGPAPSTSTPTPASAPAPSSRAPVTYTVGNNSGWAVLPPGSYETWAANKNFVIGDTLVFNFLNGTHDVAEVTKANYESCNTTNPLSLSLNPPVRITLNTTGENYFICTFPGHCAAGQKLAINVTSGSTTATPPSSGATPPSSGATPPSGSPNTPSTPTPGATSPPPPNAATSLGVAGLSATFLSIALALLF